MCITPSGPKEGHISQGRRRHPHHRGQHFGLYHLGSCSSTDLRELHLDQRALGPLREGHLPPCRRVAQLLFHSYRSIEPSGGRSAEVQDPDLFQYEYYRDIPRHGRPYHIHDEFAKYIRVSTVDSKRGTADTATRYMQFHPLAYMVKLNIELSMADLIGRVAGDRSCGTIYQDAPDSLEQPGVDNMQVVDLGSVYRSTPLI